MTVRITATLQHARATLQPDQLTRELRAFCWLPPTALTSFAALWIITP